MQHEITSARKTAVCAVLESALAGICLAGGSAALAGLLPTQAAPALLVLGTSAGVLAWLMVRTIRA